MKEQNFHITGQEAEKLGENRYRMQDVTFTTCDATRPPWRFTAKELDVSLTGSGTAKKSTFYLEDIPILYLPAAIFPVKRERQAGFLIPTTTYSQTYGLIVRTAFYWPIAKDMDATLYLAKWGTRGFKEGLEYRYAFTRDTRGLARFFFIDDKVFGDNRYAFFLRHQQKFSDDLYVKGDINYVSDIQYPRDFDADLPSQARIDSRSLRQLRSVLFGGKNWDQFSFLEDSRYFQDLTTTDNSQTVQKLPQLSFFAHPQSLLKTPLFYELNSSYTNYWREQGVGTQRLDLFPTISYPVRLLDVLKFQPSLGLRETLYSPYNDPTGQFNQFESREIYQAGMDLSAEIYRVYEPTKDSKIANLLNLNSAKLMHTIEPTVSYVYIPRVNQNELPFFDQVDQIPYTNAITYGFTQRLVKKAAQGGSGPSEYAKLRILQNYNLGDPFATDAQGEPRHLSNVKGELWLTPSPYVYGHADTEYNPYEGTLDRLNGLIGLRDRRNDVLQVEYRDTRGTAATQAIRAINVTTRVKIIDPLYFYWAIRYNLLTKTTLEQYYGAEYQGQCWTLGLVVDSRQTFVDSTPKTDLRFHFIFSLVGVGSVGRKSFFSYL